MPLVIVSVVVAYVLSARLAPAPAKSGDPGPATPATRSRNPRAGPTRPARMSPGIISRARLTATSPGYRR